MLCFETSFLVDWFRGQEYAREFLEGRPADERVIVPTVVLHELFVGTLGSGAYPPTTAAVYESLEHVTFAPLTTGAAEEAAGIRVALAERGEKINAFDTLVAGVALDAGATLVATDTDYRRVEALAVHNPRAESDGGGA